MLIPPGPWADHAVCREVDGDLWFQETGNASTIWQAKRICWDRCFVREQCLEYALHNDDQFGIFGGYTAKERRPMRKSPRA